MKPHAYRYSYPKRRARSFSCFKAIILLIVFAVLVCFQYKENIVSFIKRSLSFISEDADKISAVSDTGPPAVTIDLDGRKYTIQAQDMSAPASSGNATEIGIGKNSKLQIMFDDPPDYVSTMFYHNDVRVLSAHSQTILSEELPGDGEYQAICEASWSQGDNFKGTAVYHFNLIADFPPSISISATEIDPGELLVICVKNLAPEEKLEVETDLDFKPTPYEYGNKHIIMLPVSYYNKPGKVYQVKITMGDDVYSYAIKVRDKEFITQYMTIDTKVAAATRNEKSALEIDEKIDPLKPVSDLEPYWSGKFLMPVEGGRVTETDFGKKRYVNNSPTYYRHNGLDIGHDKGEPVMASNNGRILLADYLIETGNTVIIEHGFGLKTWYYHMDELAVKTGDWVKKGDIIGKVGSTGFSTSPHLHFSATVNGVFINPITLINEGVPLLSFE